MRISTSFPESSTVRALASVYSWAGTIGLILFFTPVIGLSRLFDRDPVRYRTGRLLRILGSCITRVNPAWSVTIDGYQVENPKHPYVVVSNHLSNADVPVISRLPWDMKWIAKEGLFKMPIVGWVMTWAGDIPVNRRDKRSGVLALQKARWYLERNSSVMFFPEGTRSRTGQLQRFKDGAFTVAIKAGVPILPMVVDGTQDCLPKNDWKFGAAPNIRLRILPPVETTGLTAEDVPELKERVRSLIAATLADWRGVPAAEVGA
ncbi:MAG: lysophospholipid acyltransferase family protein [Bacteroidota bacterium]